MNIPFVGLPMLCAFRKFKYESQNDEQNVHGVHDHYSVTDFLKCMHHTTASFVFFFRSFIKIKDI